MDFNGGTSPTDQAGSGSPQYGPQPPDLQQAPMSGTSPAYQTDSNQSASYNQPQLQQDIEQQYVQTPVAPVFQQPVQQPIQDVRPNWQQELDYSNEIEPPWTRQQAGSVAVSSGITSYTGDSLSQPNQGSNPVPAEAYDLLTAPYSDSAPSGSTGSGPKKAIFILLALVVGLSLTGGAIYAAYLTGYKKGAATISKTKQDETNTPVENSSEDPPLDEPAELSVELKQPKYIDENVEGIVGVQSEASDGLVLMVSNFKDDYKPTDSSYKAKEGRKLILVNLQVGNSDKTKSKSIKPGAFKLLSSDGVTRGEPRSDIKYEGRLESQISLSPGSVGKLSLLFEIDTNDQDLILTRSQAYQVTGTTYTTNLMIPLTSDSSPQ